MSSFECHSRVTADIFSGPRTQKDASNCAAGGLDVLTGSDGLLRSDGLLKDVTIIDIDEPTKRGLKFLLF